MWGTSGEDGDNITWGTSSGEDAPPLFDDPNAAPATFDSSVYDELFAPTPPPPAEPALGGLELAGVL